MTDARLEAIRAGVRERLARKRRSPPVPAPRYDDVYVRGVAWLDTLDLDTTHIVNPQEARHRMSTPTWTEAIGEVAKLVLPFIPGAAAFAPLVTKGLQEILPRVIALIAPRPGESEDAYTERLEARLAQWREEERRDRVALNTDWRNL